MGCLSSIHKGVWEEAFSLSSIVSLQPHQSQVKHGLWERMQRKRAMESHDI
jgi:hypothetical protein